VLTPSQPPPVPSWSPGHAVYAPDPVPPPERRGDCIVSPYTLQWQGGGGAATE